MKFYPMILAGFALCTVPSAQAYRFASVNDIHADLNYNPTSTGKCITKTPDLLAEVSEFNSLTLIR